MCGLEDTLAQTMNKASLTLIHSIFRSKPGMKDLAVELNSTSLITPHTKFEAIFSKDLGGDRFQAKIWASRQISYPLTFDS